jgi:WD40 repeat protein
MTHVRIKKVQCAVNGSRGRRLSELRAFAGLCALSPSTSNPLLAIPGPTEGTVRLYDLGDTSRAPTSIVAHENAIVCLALNFDGTRLATASKKVK